MKIHIQIRKYYFFFFCLLKFCENKKRAPKITLISTGNGRVRFNPNLYSNGYICLSLLGTWRGDVTETWNPVSGNLM